jgi:hypothetical protein
VYGSSDVGTGVAGLADEGTAVSGFGRSGTGVSAQSEIGTAIYAAQTGDPDVLPDTVVAETSSNQHAAVAAHNNGKGFGVWTNCDGGTAIYATNIPGAANATPADADAFVAFTASPNHAAVGAHNNSAQSTKPQPNGFGVWASSNNTAIYGQGSPAGYFLGLGSTTDAIG